MKKYLSRSGEETDWEFLWHTPEGDEDFLESMSTARGVMT